MSANTKRTLLIVGIAAVFCVAAVGLAVGGLALLGNRFKDSVVSDPVKIRQMAHGFIDYQLPPGYEELTGMDLMVYKMIIISHAEPSSKPIIFLAQFQSQSMTPEQMSQQMQQSMNQQNGRSGLKFKVIETRKMTINGKETSVTVSEGTDATGFVFRQWITFFPAKSGLVMFMAQGDAAEWDDAALESFLASITT